MSKFFDQRFLILNIQILFKGKWNKRKIILLQQSNKCTYAKFYLGILQIINLIHCLFFSPLRCYFGAVLSSEQVVARVSTSKEYIFGTRPGDRYEALKKWSLHTDSSVPFSRVQHAVSIMVITIETQKYVQTLLIRT